MGILPLEFLPGENLASLGLTGRESFTINGVKDGLVPRSKLQVMARADDGRSTTFQATCRIDGPIELDYYRNGGILPAVLRRLARDGAPAGA
jgi:aconitate hydratase